ncbi:MAG: phosphoserine phosphatase SerB [Betaproteobacteria bacterium]
MHLIVQAPEIGAAELASIAERAGAQGIHPLEGGGQQAYRLSRVQTRAGVAEFCAAAGIDCAFVPPDLTRDRVRVVALDMDSTLITIECIDEIADMIGIKPQVAAITASAMRGEIDFRESLTRRVSLLAGMSATALERVYAERLQLTPGAERLLAGFAATGAKTLLVSGGFTFFTDRLQARLAIDETAANALEIADGKLTGRLVGNIVDAQVKAARLRAMRARYGHGGLVVAIGDGANDLPMLRQADISIAYRAKPVVRAEATYAINRCGIDAVLNLFA